MAWNVGARSISGLMDFRRLCDVVAVKAGDGAWHSHGAYLGCGIWVEDQLAARLYRAIRRFRQACQWI